jgi:fused signal recognition particle receptor
VIVLVVILAALVVGAAGGWLGLRRRRRRTVVRLAPPRTPLPEILVPTVSVRPTLAPFVPPTLADKLGTSRGLFDRVRGMGAPSRLTTEELEVVEEVLLRSDVGVATTGALVAQLRERGAPEGVAAATRTLLLATMCDADRSLHDVADDGRVPVWLFVGVNGVGKTTTIGKVAHRFVAAGRSVTVAAGDTFRAAAVDQLALWAQRSGADLVRATEGADPSSVIHDALGRASARRAGMLLADTAGRKHTSANLLDELAKIRRVADRAPGQVLETLLVLDATTGQNAIAQAREFLQASGVTGVVLTKLDGTARGGVVVAIERELGVPVKLTGVGEGIDDLVDFDPTAFVDALLGG